KSNFLYLFISHKHATPGAFLAKRARGFVINLRLPIPLATFFSASKTSPKAEGPAQLSDRKKREEAFRVPARGLPPSASQSLTRFLRMNKALAGRSAIRRVK